MRASVIHIVILCILIVSGCKGPEGPMGPEGPPGAGIGSLSDPSIMPKVMYTYPPKNSVGPYENFYLSDGWIYANNIIYFPVYISQFEIRFNKYMDPASVRRSVAITSPLGDVHADTNYVIALGGDLYLINPVDANGYRSSRWRIGQNYTFSVSSNARDINGNALNPPFSMNFMPEPYFRVRAISPVNGATNVIPWNGNIVLTLNSTVDTSIRSLVQINPPIFGEWFVSYDSMSMSFQTQSLKDATTYTITIGTDAHDTYGNHLLQPFGASFTTLPFEISSTSPGNNATGVGVMQTIEVDFTAVLDTSTIRQAVAIHPFVAGQFNFYNSSPNVQFVPSSEMLFDTLYTVTVDTTIRGIDGARLTAPYTFSFRTAPFGIAYTYPSDGSSGNPTNTAIQVSMNAMIDAASVPTSFELFDSSHVAVAGSIVVNSNSFTLTPTSSLKPFALYTGIVSTGLRSLQGKTLSAPYAFSFMTSN